MDIQQEVVESSGNEGSDYMGSKALLPERDIFVRDQRVLLFSVLVCSGCCNNIPQMGWLIKQKYIFSQSWRPSSTRSRCQPGRFLARSPFPVCKQLSSCCDLTWPFILCACLPRISFSSNKDTSPTGFKPNPQDLI